MPESAPATTLALAVPTASSPVTIKVARARLAHELQAVARRAFKSACRIAVSSADGFGGDEMTVDPDDGDAVDASKTYKAICSTSDEVADIIG